ncbi:M1 family metallopeptidase [Segetibacter koreensis]|uniref:M1 family metallopeptidase n=1 Tax=Segetibacter koreensis TaxID=398037 RepID=UPI00035EA12E|nr:M1 family metallopeptidase [Segetibacter koreensis]
MSVVRVFAVILFIHLLTHSFAQKTLPVPVNIQKLYEQETRSYDGKPGDKYWQNTANYDIHVAFDPASLLLEGAEKITYINNSPDTLYNIVFKLYPNFYKKGSERLAKIEPEDIGEGMMIDKINVTNSPVLTYSLDGTNMSVTIEPLLPKDTIVFNISFHYTLNKGSHTRTGQVEENAAFVAYFFPRIAVYDDIDGWNKNQYLGTQEFYNDFCNFKASVTVPKNFVVWATGDLTNCNEVFKDKYCRLIQQAEKADTITNIIDSADLQAGNITADNETNTWHFTADNVTDFVFATSNHYLWKSSSVLVDSATSRRTRVDGVFNQKHTDFYDVTHYNRETVKAMSYSFLKWPFPYSHETVFDGLDQMEYPMMVNDNPVAGSTDAITLTDHEVFHTMFPFYMGINETKYGWMDEGWATMAEWLISPMIDSSIVDEYGIKPYETNAGKERDVPITTLTTQLNDMSLYLNSYVKPALGYLYVKDYLGDELFTKALHYYLQQWNGKHPMPYDFFNCINVGSGKNLNWFWKSWFFDNGVPDLSIDKVKKRRHKYKVTIKSKGTKPVPVDLFVTLKDNSVIKQHRSISVWEKGNATTNIIFHTKKDVLRITLGSTYTVDVNKDDNRWDAK